jgi:uncharacterized protein YihD (DUF1040 family)
MEKSDYIYMIKDNTLVLGVQLPTHLQGDALDKYLISLPAEVLEHIAGFDKKFLEFFFNKSQGKSGQELTSFLDKLTKISYFVGPVGELAYLTEDQVKYILSKIDDIKQDDITPHKINVIADELLIEQFGSALDQQQVSFENQLQNIRFYMKQMGYSAEEIEQKIKEAGTDQQKLDALFSLSEKTIVSRPQMPVPGSRPQGETIGQGMSENIGEAPAEFSLDSLRRQVPEITEERARKVEEIMVKIKDKAKESLTEDHEAIFVEIHPDRLNRMLNILKKGNRKSKKFQLLLDWFMFSLYIDNIEVKVEHWQVSSHASSAATGVYTAGIPFGRYDKIVEDFPEKKLEKVINIIRRILANPTKDRIQKLGQDLTAETGFDEHLYFTD